MQIFIYTCRFKHESGHHSIATFYKEENVQEETCINFMSRLEY